MVNDDRSFLQVFDSQYYRLLDIRRDTFRKMFQLLEQRQKASYTIVETGTARKPGDWKYSGQSTLLFDAFVNFHHGRVLSVDIDPEVCRQARSRVSPRTSIICSDSVQFLQNLSDSNSIDLLYLDSYDADWGNTHPSALHHLMELCAVIPKLDHAVIAVNDNLPLHCSNPGDLRAWYGQMGAAELLFSNTVGLYGKGEYVDRFMRTIGKRRVISGYQVGYVYNKHRVVVSLTTLPSRIGRIGQTIASLKRQTLMPDVIYLSLPHFSKRESRGYDIPPELLTDPAIHILRPETDWGPASKLLPVLLRERDESTFIISVDDDKVYHETLVEDLVAGSKKHPDCALGFAGYRLRGEPYRHPNFEYRRASIISQDLEVDALGGVCGVLYRRSFFGEEVFEYARYPDEAFFVDDDWIAGNLARQRVRRIVLSSDGFKSRHDQVPGIELGNGLNSKANAARNIHCQEVLLTRFKSEGLFSA